MTFRQEIDKRLKLIQEAVASDPEYDELTIPESPTAKDYYDACKAIIASRGSLGTSLERLKSLAKALDNLTYDSVVEVKSNIFIGARLEV